MRTFIKLLTNLSLITILILLTSCTEHGEMIDKRVVKDFSIEPYLGKWYEIARYDHSFERGLVGVTANYSLRDDGKIKVVNAGYKGTLEGERSEATGKAKIPDPRNPAKLKVSFFWIFYGDYFVLELDEDYQWAVIGSSSDKYLWILARAPQINEDLYLELTNRLDKRGYDVNKLIRVEQRSRGQ